MLCAIRHRVAHAPTFTANINQAPESIEAAMIQTHADDYECVVSE